MKKEIFEEICRELNGVFYIDEYGAMICIFPNPKVIKTNE